MSFSDWIELLGFVLVAVAVGFLAGFWWGVLVAGVLVVALGVVLGVRAERVRVPDGDS